MNSHVDLTDQIIEAWHAPKDGRPRAYALMGPNGSGKSRQLKAIRESLAKRSVPCLLLPPDRQVVQISTADRYPGGAALHGSTMEETWNAIIKWFFSPTQQQLQLQGSGVPFGLILGALIERAVSMTRWAQEAQMRALWEWHEDQTRSEPSRLSPSRPLQVLEQKLGEILDCEVKISVPPPPHNSGGAQISFRRGDNEPFPVARLSSGEQQILLISTFLLGSVVDRFIFLVDEPELYLNEALASRIWERFEITFPNAVFLYATHSPTFATRPAVTDTFLIGMDGVVEKIDKTKPVPSSVLREIVGARVQLLLSDACPIFCEDDLSRMILDDLFANQNVLPIRLNGWESVCAAVKREGAWEQNLRSASPAFCGVIDRDTWSTDEIENFKKANVFCLPRYDAETVLLDPELACWSLSTSVGRTLSKDEWTSMLVTTAEKGCARMLKKLSKHLARRQEHIIEYDQYASGITNVRVFPWNILQKTFEDKAEALHSAVVQKDVDGILTMFEGKWLYAKIASEAGKRYNLRLGTAIQRYREIRMSDEFRPRLRRVSWLFELRSAIEAHLSPKPP